MIEEEMERQLSRLFHAAVGEPPQHVSLSGIRRLVVRRRIVMSIAAIVGIALAGSAGLAASAYATSTPAVGHGQAAAPPRYYFQEADEGRLWLGQRVVIRATATGAITGTVRCPWPHAFIGEAAVAAPETIYLLCFRGVPEPWPGSGFVTTGTRIYKFGLTGAGRPVDYRLVPGGVFLDATVDGLAVAANGSEFAVNVKPNRKGASSAIVVVNTRTGARAHWNGTTLPGGFRFAADPELSLTANGRELAVLGIGRCPKGPGTCKSPGEEMLALSPAWKGGQLASGRKVFTQSQVMNVRFGFVYNAFLTPDGSAVTIGLMFDNSKASHVAVVQVSARTAKLGRVLYKVNLPVNGVRTYQFVGADPTGKYVLVDAGPYHGPDNGWIDHGKLINLKPADGYLGGLGLRQVNQEAW